MDRFSKIGIVFGVIAAIGVAGYIFYRNQRTENPDNKIEAGNTNNGNNEGENQSDVVDNSSWESYISDADEFEIKHPSDITAETTEGGSIIFKFKTGDKGTNGNLLSVSGGELGDKDFEEFVKDQATAQKNIPNIESVADPSRKQINDKEAWEFKVIGKEAENTRTFLYIQQNQSNYILVIDMTTGKDNEQNKDIAYTMISTLDLR